MKAMRLCSCIWLFRMRSRHSRHGCPGEQEPLVDCDGKPTAISAVFGRMRTCTDVMPIRVLDDVQALLDDPALAALEGATATYVKRRALRARLRGTAESGLTAECRRGTRRGDLFLDSKERRAGSIGG